MPTTITTTHTKDGALLRIELVRRSTVDVGITIEILETDSRNGVPESSRRRVFHNKDLTPTQVANLTSLFNAIETRIKTVHYS